MCKHFIKCMNEKMWVLISLIINLIADIFLFVWKNDSTKIVTINVIDKIAQSILNILVLLKNRTFAKKEKNQKLGKQEEKEEKEENKVLEEGKELLNALSTEEKIIRNLEKLAIGNDKNAKNKAKNLLESIMNQKKIMINKIKIIEKK